MSKAKFPLPSVVNPPNRIGVCVPVPDDPGHRQAFLGAIYSLARARSWTDDPDMPAKPVADVWASIWANVRDQLDERNGCDAMTGVEDVRQRTGAPCKLDKLVDGDWVQFADLRLCTPLIRTGTGGGIEVSTDGETWTPTETATPAARDPDAGENVNRCLAAANAVNVLVSLHYEVSRSTSVPTGLALAGIIAGFLIAILFVPFSVGLILALITGGAAAVFAALPMGAFTAEIQEELQCMLYCAATDDGDGNVTFDFDQVRAAIAPNITPLGMWAALDYYMQIIGEDGLNRAGATTEIAEATCDCPDCPDEWCYEWTDFAGWTQITVGQGEWSNYLAKSFPATIPITRIECWYTWSGSIPGTSDAESLWSTSSSFVPENRFYYNTGTGVLDGYIDYGTPISLSVLTVGVNRTYDTGDGGITINKIRLHGTGVNPFGSDNCSP